MKLDDDGVAVLAELGVDVGEAEAVEAAEGVGPCGVDEAREVAVGERGKVAEQGDLEGAGVVPGRELAGESARPLRHAAAGMARLSDQGMARCELDERRRSLGERDAFAARQDGPAVESDAAHGWMGRVDGDRAAVDARGDRSGMAEGDERLEARGGEVGALTVDEQAGALRHGVGDGLEIGVGVVVEDGGGVDDEHVVALEIELRVGDGSAAIEIVVLGGLGLRAAGLLDVDADGVEEGRVGQGAAGTAGEPADAEARLRRLLVRRGDGEPVEGARERLALRVVEAEPQEDGVADEGAVGCPVEEQGARDDAGLDVDRPAPAGQRAEVASEQDGRGLGARQSLCVAGDADLADQALAAGDGRGHLAAGVGEDGDGRRGAAEGVVGGLGCPRRVDEGGRVGWHRFVELPEDLAVGGETLPLDAALDGGGLDGLCAEDVAAGRVGGAAGG